jgi:hypothetical protein
MSYRVVQWSTGNVGMLALRTIIEHPDMELVGLLVHSAAKAGQDAGTLCGAAPTGVIATNDANEVLALKPDVVCYTATGDLRPHEAVADMCRILESGANVVSSSVVSLVYPPAADKAYVAQLQAACEKGGSSFFTSGIDPGFGNDLMPLTLTGFAQRIDAVRVMEILNYDTYDQPTVLFDTMGFGLPPEETPLLLMPGVLTLAWGSVVHMIAAGLGVELDEVRERHERWNSDRKFETPGGVIEEGTMAGLRFEVIGVVRGREAIVVEHVTRMRDDAAPDWPQPAGAGSYRILIEGNPKMKCELELLGEGGDHNAGGVLATATRIINAIPAVVAASPGLLSPLDLPLVTGRHLLS